MTVPKFGGRSAQGPGVAPAGTRAWPRPYPSHNGDDRPRGATTRTTHAMQSSGREAWRACRECPANLCRVGARPRRSAPAYKRHARAGFGSARTAKPGAWPALRLAASCPPRCRRRRRRRRALMPGSADLPGRASRFRYGRPTVWASRLQAMPNHRVSWVHIQTTLRSGRSCCQEPRDWPYVGNATACQPSVRSVHYARWVSQPEVFINRGKLRETREMEGR
jgi:hypothetical protein